MLTIQGFGLPYQYITFAFHPSRLIVLGAAIVFLIVILLAGACGEARKYDDR